MITAKASTTVSNHSRPLPHPISHLLDLCLYRVVEQYCKGRILPFEVRQLIKEYIWMAFSNETLRAAVQLWCRDRTTAFNQYGDINDWEVSKVTNMASLFAGCSTFNDRIDRWDVRQVTSMCQMFTKASTFNQPLDTWNVGQVTTMAQMFDEATAFNQPLAAWDVSQCVSMQRMFGKALSFNQPLSTWDVHRVTNMKHMFNGAAAFNQPLERWNVSRVTNMCLMFRAASSFNQPLAAWNVSQVTDMSGMFLHSLSGTEYSVFNQPLDNWDVRQVTNMCYMFAGATAFQSILGDLGRSPCHRYERSVSPGVVLQSTFVDVGYHARDQYAAYV